MELHGSAPAAGRLWDERVAAVNAERRAGGRLLLATWGAEIAGCVALRFTPIPPYRYNPVEGAPFLELQLR